MMQSGFDALTFFSSALAEDIATGDVTAAATIPETLRGHYLFIARTPMILAGAAYLEPMAKLVDATLTLNLYHADGTSLSAGEPIAEISGSVRSILALERTALNLMQHLSGIATLTAHYVQAVSGTDARILDTRKTLPGLRYLQKYAVRCGGGENHRMGLYDAILIKDNHIAAMGGDVVATLAAARAHAKPGMLVEIECDTPAQLEAVIRAGGVDRVLLDNMDNATLHACVQMAKAAGLETEASGNVTLDTVRGIAQTGVDYISIGRLTHSAPAADIGLDAHFHGDDRVGR